MKKVLILALALVLLLGIAARGTFGLFSDTETSSGNTFTAWVEEVVCAKFNVSDKSDAKIYKYDYPPRTFVGSFDLSWDSGFPTGVAAVGGYIYVLNHPDHRVYQYTCSGGLVDVSKDLLKLDGTSSIGRSQGLAIYGTQMWVLDKNIYQYSLLAAFLDDGSTLTATKEISLDEANTGAIGLAIDSTYLYVLDFKTSGSDKEMRFYRYDRITGACGIGDISKVLKDATATGSDIGHPGCTGGAMFDGTFPNGSLWVVDSGTNKMYQYNIASLFADDGSTTINAMFEFPLDSANDDATGV